MAQSFDPKQKTLPVIRRIATTNSRVEHLVAAVEDGVQVGIGVGRIITSPSYSHTGPYIYFVYIHQDYRSSGHGFDIVGELCRRFVDDGWEGVFLIRPADEGRVFQGGFGFTPVPNATFPETVGNAMLFEAFPPDPD